MSQDASISQVLLNPLSDAPSGYDSGHSVEADGSIQTSKFPVDSYADRLMDELFEDVEQMLGNMAKLPSEPARQEEPPPPPMPSTTAVLGLPLVAQPQVECEAATLPPPAEVDLLPVTAFRPELRQPGKVTGRSYDRLLLGVGCISLMTTLALWLLYREANLSPVVTAPSVQTETTTLLGSDAQFAKYIGQSLKSIEQRTQPTGATVASGPASTNTALPTVSVPTTTGPGIASGGPLAGSIAGLPSRTATGLERVYVPIYQLPQTLGTPKPSIPFKITPPVAPLPKTSVSGGAATTMKPSVPLSSGLVARTLVGMVEMGEESAILVEINGVAQRFRLGESIGVSGWTLVEVSKNQAIIRRNGEVRSIFIGQSF